MNITIVRTPLGYDLVVNGVPFVRSESFAVCDNVADDLRHGPSTDECGEVAASILVSMRKGF